MGRTKDRPLRKLGPRTNEQIVCKNGRVAKKELTGASAGVYLTKRLNTECLSTD